jgi:exoribonuclease R
VSDRIGALEAEQKNCATEIIEDFMIAANGVTARYLDAKKSPSIRRVVRTPKRWDRNVLRGFIDFGCVAASAPGVRGERGTSAV